MSRLLDRVVPLAFLYAEVRRVEVGPGVRQLSARSLSLPRVRLEEVVGSVTVLVSLHSVVHRVPVGQLPFP